MKKATINQFLADFDGQASNSYGFYDWFCKDSALKREAETFLPKLRFLVEAGILNGDTTYVWFKNNCPLSGQLYTDMRFSTVEGDEFIGGIAPRLGYYGNSFKKASIWFLSPGKELEEIEVDSWRQLKGLLADTDSELHKKAKSHFYRA